MKLVSSKGIR